MSGKHNEAASIVKTDPLRDPDLEAADPVKFLFKLICLANIEDLRLVRDNNPGEQVQLLHCALLTLLFDTCIWKNRGREGMESNKLAVEAKNQVTHDINI